MTPHRWPALDGLRGVAVGLVLFGHYFSAGGFGRAGVNLFFGLSGFLITWLLLREYDIEGAISLRRFYWRRTWRIVPAYAAWLAFTLYANRGSVDEGRAWALATYTVNYYQVAHPEVTGVFVGLVEHAWSLSVEEQFYIMWPLIALLALRRGRIFAVAVVSIVAVIAWRTTGVLVLGIDAYAADRTFFMTADFLMAGCLLAIVERRWGFERLRPLARSQLLPLATLIVLVLVTISVQYVRLRVVAYGIEAALGALLLAQVLLLHDRPAFRWLDRPAARWVGTISYPMYLWHLWGLYGASQVFQSEWSIAFAATVLTVGLAVGSYYTVERAGYWIRDRPRAL